MRKVYLHKEQDHHIWNGDGTYITVKTGRKLTYSPRNNNANSKSDEWIVVDSDVSGTFRITAIQNGSSYAWVCLEKDSIVYRITDDDFILLLGRVTVVDGCFTTTLRWVTAGGEYYLTGEFDADPGLQGS